MKQSKQQKLERNGWRIGTACDFLGLTAEESTYIEMKLALSEALRNERENHNLSQTQLANLIASSQSRVAKMESADSSVSIDLLIKSLLALGVARKKLAQTIAA